MEGKIIEELIVFVGLMATLGSITKIVLTIINRRRPALNEAKVDEIAVRLSRMEQAIDATAVEVERISEAQRFTTKLLVEKGHHPQASESARRVVTPH